jgi:hypothetical protein
MNVWIRALIAVVVGNALWFVVLQPQMPPALRHRPLSYDLGLLLDFILCLTLYVLLGRIRSRKDTPPPHA